MSRCTLVHPIGWQCTREDYHLFQPCALVPRWWNARRWFGPWWSR